MIRVSLILAVLWWAVPASVLAQAPPDDQAVQTPPAFAVVVDVIATTPLPGVGLTADQIPAAVQVTTAADIDASGALDLSEALTRRLTSVHTNNLQGNPFQADISYRGYTASPLLGTPQGLSIFMDGVRINQPFGDVVSWDLIPRLAIASSVLMPGSNPLFGLNTLGGALALRTKDGHSHPGTTVQAIYGSYVRRAIEFEHGGSTPRGLNWYLAANLFGEDGWRDVSPSNVRQVFGKVGWLRAKSDVSVTLAHANNSLNGNGLQETRLLERDYASVYTKPDNTANRSTFLNLVGRRTTSRSVTMSGNAYYRHIRTATINGDINEDSLDQSLYQPGAAERAALAAAGVTNVPADGATAANTPFPFLRCIANILLEDEPGEKCNGLVNRARTTQHSEGVSGQATHQDDRNQLTAGAAYDRSRVGLTQSTELGYLNPDRSITGTGIFADGVSAGNVDDEPLDARIDLNGRIQTVSFFATDTLTLSKTWHVTVSGRYNRTTVRNSDGIDPGGGPGSLDGRHTFSRLNPAVGVTFNPSSALNAYAGYTEGSRAATSIELGCADPDTPCKLPNAMAGDPPLNQVVTKTVEAGLRGHVRARTSWTLGVFHADNHDDILFVTSRQTGLGYFRNFGQTRRQGLEVGVTTRGSRASLGAGYTFLSATYQSVETVNGSSNSTNQTAEDGVKGLEGSIVVEPGSRIPLVPRQMLKVFGEIEAAPKLSIGFNLVAVSSSYARGNENNRHESDGTYYLGPGASPGYAVLNLDGRYHLRPRLDIFAQLSNALDRRYSSAAQLGPNGFAAAGTFVARPLPAVDGAFPLVRSTFFAPGAPRQVLIGTRIRF